MPIVFEHTILVFSLLLFFSIFVGKIGYKFGVPALLLFLLVGILAGGEGFGGIYFEDFKTAQNIGTVALCVILFSGGLDTQYSEIRPVLKQGLLLATLGVVLTAFAMAGFIYLVLDIFFPDFQLTFIESLLLASVMSSTDSASVFSILRSRGLSLKHNLRPMLELESGSNDPIAYMLTIVIIGIITGETSGFWDIALTFGMQLVLGVLEGVLIGRLFVRIINRINVGHDSLYPILVLTGALFIFSFTSFVGGNGFLAVYLGGLVIGNHKFIHKRTSKDFFEGFAWLMQIVMFLTLGLLVNPSELIPIMGAGLILALGLILFARPIAVILCLFPFKRMMNKDRTYVSWVGLRGAVPIIFAIYPLVYDIPHAKLMFNFVFFITIVSLLVQGTSLSWFADLLKLTHQISKRRRLKHFDVAFSEDVKSIMTEINVNNNSLQHGSHVMDLPIPDNSLVVMVKRGSKYILPKGNTPLQENDKLLVLTDDEDSVNKLHELFEV
ncbi:MAG: potassium/proton antiporter [Bacteroidales bacterium]|jgi:cell volume regulation protein A|nr:potassium/proton antiporter [Bacteroidales bacterium]